MYESLLGFPGSLFDEIDRLRQEMDSLFPQANMPASIRSVAPGSFPAINVGNTPTSVEVYAFAPGIDPTKLELTIDRGVLTLAGSRPSSLPDGETKVSAYSRERPFGEFKRAVSLPDDVDPERIQATYRDGVLHVSMPRRESAMPKRIVIE